MALCYGCLVGLVKNLVILDRRCPDLIFDCLMDVIVISAPYNKEGSIAYLAYIHVYVETFQVSQVTYDITLVFIVSRSKETFTEFVIFIIVWLLLNLVTRIHHELLHFHHVLIVLHIHLVVYHHLLLLLQFFFFYLFFHIHPYIFYLFILIINLPHINIII